jgi:outer membrane receptor protein involved in Fe transport
MFSQLNKGEHRMNTIKLILFACAFVFGQEGTIAGKIFDKNTGEALIGANIFLEGTSFGAASDFDGGYQIKAPNGSYTLLVDYVSYTPLKITNVKIEADKVNRINLELTEDMMRSDVVIVEAKLYDNNVNGLLVKQKNSSKVFDAISSEQIKKTGDSNVSAALKRVTGITIVGGKNVFVRGLGNRYSNVQLNGSSVPSTNPNKKEVPLDIFPANILDNIVVQKTYSADQPGEFSGGSVQLVTKNFLDEPFLSFSVSSGYNTKSTLSSVLDHESGSLDFIGFDDGNRGLPSKIGSMAQMPADDAASLNAFEHSWDTKKSTILPNIGLSLGYGNNFTIGEKSELSIIATLSQSSKSSYKTGIDKALRTPTSFKTDYETVETSYTGRLTAMLNMALKLSPNHTLSLKNLFTNQGERSTTKIDGRYLTNSGVYHQNVLRFVQETVFNTSLKSEAYFRNFYNSKLKTELTYSQALRDEPDKRNTHYVSNDETTPRSLWTVNLSEDGNKRFFSKQTDDNIEFKSDIELDVTAKHKAKLGALFLKKDRDFSARQFVFVTPGNSQLTGGISGLDPNELFTSDHLANNLSFIEKLDDGNQYVGEQTLFASYLADEFLLTENLKSELGIRYEFSDQQVNQSSLVKNHDILPAINLTYKLAENTNMRLAYSHTVARPEFREISKFSFQDFVGGEFVFGNPDLKRTLIKNIDLRYETFPTAGELLSTSIFFKDFTDPIEQFSRANQNNEIKFGNVSRAYLFGAEFEFRKQVFTELNISGNVSFIKSEVDYSKNASNLAEIGTLKRPMFGQSPYTINLNANYLVSETVAANLAYNTFGERISKVGNSEVKADRYEQPFHKLDFVLSYKLNAYNFKFSVQNILGDDVEHIQNGKVVKSYDVGTDVGLSLSYKF